MSHSSLARILPLLALLVGALYSAPSRADLTCVGASGPCDVNQGTWATSLQARDLDGNPATIEAYYDTAQNLTWLADANPIGLTGWAAAQSWVASLTTGGVSWRLPTLVDSGSAGCPAWTYSGSDCGYNAARTPGTAGPPATPNASELAYMFYDILGNKAAYSPGGVSQSGYGITNTALFTNLSTVLNLQSNAFWTGNAYALAPSSLAWIFHANNGFQDADFKSGTYRTWAVHDGDIAPVPLPASAWLLIAGLAGLATLSRRRALA
jgi:hypothetical protein